MEVIILKSSEHSLEKAYNSILKKIKDHEKEKGTYHYYKIQHTVAFSKDDKETLMYCFEVSLDKTTFAKF